nr:DNA internalization-related competence protein ComEC/Rec2 [uncultured Roseateles sp.]
MASCLSSLLGMAGVQLLAELPGAAALFGLCLAALSLLGLGWRWRQPAVLVLAFALLGVGYGAWRAQLAMNQQLPSTWEGRDISLLGLVASLPQPAVGMAGDPGWRFQFEVEAVLTPGAQVPSRLLLAAYGPGEAAPSRWRVGDQWRLTVRLRRPHGLMNPHGFDYELWLLEQGLRATGTVRPNAQPLQVAAAYPVDRLRQSLRDSIYQHVPDGRAAGVLAALSLGDQAAITREDWALYRQTGIAHLMAISGLHITMFAWLFGALIGRLWRLGPGLMLWLPAPQAALWGGVAAALAYALFAGWGVPAQRTVWMLATLAVLRSQGRLWPWPLLLLAAAWVVCVIDPWALTQAGFWLSFVAVGLLMATGPDQPVAVAAQGWTVQLRHSLRSTWHTQWVATVGLAPLSLLLFQQVSVVGMAANLLAIPLVTLLITPLALLGAALPLLWQAAAWLVQALNLGLQGLATQPMAVWSVPVAPLWAQASGLLAGLLLVLPLPWRVRALGLPLALPLLWPVLPQIETGRFEVLAIDVGQGTAVLVRTREHLLLYDSGPAYAFDSNAGQRVILPLLRARGERRIDMLMLSHRDSDHVGGAASILKEFDVHALSSSLETGHPLLQGAPQPTPCLAGQRWQWDGVSFEVLHPLPEAYTAANKSNAMSCVLRVSSAQSGQSLLLTGDIEAAQEQALVARAGPALRSQVLIVPHHGSKTSSTPEFLDAVAPQTAIFQAGYRNRFGHPAPVVMARYEERQIATLTSADCGAWRWDGVNSVCERERRRRYWHAPGKDALVSPPADEPDLDARFESPL